MRRLLLDTAIFLYALGGESPYRESCRRVVGLAGDRRLEAEASVELVQELWHVSLRRGLGRTEVRERADLVGAVCRLHPFEQSDLEVGLQLFGAHERLHTRDAIHAATALNRDIDAILTADRAFDDVPGLQRVDPLDTARIDTLAAP